MQHHLIRTLIVFLFFSYECKCILNDLVLALPDCNCFD